MKNFIKNLFPEELWEKAKNSNEQIFEKVAHDFYLQQRKKQHTAYRLKQIKYIRLKRKTFFYYFSKKFFKKSIFLIDKNLFI